MAVKRPGTKERKMGTSLTSANQREFSLFFLLLTATIEEEDTQPLQLSFFAVSALFELNSRLSFYSKSKVCTNKRGESIWVF